MTSKIADPLSKQQAEAQVHGLIHSWPILELTPWIVIEAIRGTREHQFSYWDAQIWASALLHQVPYILSEDFQDGSFTEGIRSLNPLKKNFHLSDLE